MPVAMKNIIVLLAVMVILSPAMAQTNIEKHISFKGEKSVTLDIQFADTIVIHTWNKQEVYAKASVNINDNMDNEVYLTSFNEEGDNVTIKATFDKNYFKGGKHNCIETMIIWEIYLPDNTAFTVETIDGNIAIDGKTTEIEAKTVSGFIDWIIRPDCKADMELKTISGTFYSDLDINNGYKSKSLPQVLTQKINDGGYPVKLETISGDIFCRKLK
jgi:hypothetical protein